MKPWDDETDMAKLEECVRSIQMDGLVWGQCKNLLPRNYLIKAPADHMMIFFHHLSTEYKMTVYVWHLQLNFSAQEM